MAFVDSNWTKILRILMGRIQEAENVWQQLLLLRFVNNATGVTLTLLGKIVGQERDGITDDDIFRRYVRARIAANRSNGLGENLINISRLVLGPDGGTPALEQMNVATVRVQIFDEPMTDAVADALFDLLYVSKGDGIRLVLEWIESPPANVFRLDSGPGLDVGHLAGGRDGNDGRGA